MHVMSCTCVMHRVLRHALRAVEQRQPAEVRGHLVRAKRSGQGKGEVGVGLWEDAARPTLQGGCVGPLCWLGGGAGVSGWG